VTDGPTQWWPLPNHEHHRRRLLTAIAAESAPEDAGERASAGRLSGWARSRGRLTPAMAAVAVLLVVAVGLGVNALLRSAGQPDQSGTGPAPAGSSPGPRPSAVGGGEWSVTQQYTVTAPVSSMIVKDGAGSVSVAAGSGSEVSVTAKIYYRTDRPAISHAVSGRTLSLGYSACADCGVTFTVTVPRAASVTIDEHTGEVTVANLAGDVSVNDETGMVKLVNLTGDVSVRDGTGEVIATGLSSALATFRDGTGMIDVAFNVAPRQVSAVSETGMVAVRVPSGTTYKVTASSQTGLVDDSVPQSAAATHVITATTRTGMVSVSTG
jgi:hypothetical protein